MIIRNEKDLGGLRASGRILVDILLALRNKAKVGVVLIEFEELAKAMLKDAGAGSAFLNYHPEGSSKSYPFNICTSLNDQVVHGEPTSYTLQSGDVLKLDFGVVYKGYITDAALTVALGEASPEVKKLLGATEESLRLAIAEARKGNTLGDIGWAIENHVETNGLSIIAGLTGHGVGLKLHEEPSVYNYGRKGEGMKLKEGMVLAIEPMVSLGTSQIRQNKDDESYSTKDGSMSAHFEKTIVITNNGPEILTPF
ncbi:MAG: type I methionyl aminopeptidase [Patescibacteria group bacterium]